MQHRRRRLSDEQGATLVEFALLAPLLFALLFGITTAGLAYSSNLALESAVREAGRFAATRPIDGDLSTWLTAVADVAVASATGDLDDGKAGRTICVAYVHPDGTESGDTTTKLTVAEDGTRLETPGTACFADGRPNDERRVQLAATREADIEAIIYSQTVTLSGRSTVRYERANQ